MVRWIAFDDDTADALVGKFKRGVRNSRRDVLDSSLHHDEANILIYPSASRAVLLARVTSSTSAKAPRSR
jgi:hypothetical protein